MGVRSVILVSNNLSVQLSKFVHKIQVWKTTHFHVLFVTYSHEFWETTHIDAGTSRTYKIAIYCPANTKSETRRDWLQDKPLTGTYIGRILL